MSYRNGGIAFLLLVAAPTALPHGAAYEREPEAPAEVLRLRYAAGGAMDGAEVRISRPDDGGLFQVGRSDPAGRFAFVPDGPGEWLVEADDGQGHQLQARIAVGAAPEQGAARNVAIPPLALLGALFASLLLNAGLFSAWRAQKRPRH